MQVEDNTCLTGGADGVVRLWDLRRVGAEDGDDEGWSELSEVPGEETESDSGLFRDIGEPAGQNASRKERDYSFACVRALEGHSRAVTAMFFEGNCLVTGAADKTLRQWDLATGQCVLTMDILWAMSHPPPSIGGAPLPAYSASAFAVAAPPAADGSWDMYTDFVGGVQFWGHALVSGSGDGAVRMWDSKLFPDCASDGCTS